jgi:hypothetical protein
MRVDERAAIAHRKLVDVVLVWARVASWCCWSG